MNYKVRFKSREIYLEGELINDYDEIKHNPMELKLENQSFFGFSFDDFTYSEKDEQNLEEMNARFTFAGSRESDPGTLCDCEFEFSVPVIIIDKLNKFEIETELQIKITLGKPAGNGGIEFQFVDFIIKIGEEEFRSTGDMFEIAFFGLEDQILDKFHFKNCFGCMYSDYSPGGNGFFGTMMCFKKNKLNYLKIKSKMDLFALMEKGFMVSQEIYLCNEFQIRNKGTGYRG